MDKTNFVMAALMAAVVIWMLLKRRGDISSAEAHRLVAAGARLLDVRTAGEFAGRHIDGALNIPVQELESRVGEVGPRDKPVVVYCLSGARSARAVGILKAAGFSTVRNLGSFTRW